MFSGRDPTHVPRRVLWLWCGESVEGRYAFKEASIRVSSMFLACPGGRQVSLLKIYSPNTSQRKDNKQRSKHKNNYSHESLKKGALLLKIKHRKQTIKTSRNCPESRYPVGISQQMTTFSSCFLIQNKIIKNET